MKKFKLIITVDTNDADYKTVVRDVNEQDLVELMPIFEAINNFKPYTNGWKHDHNWPCGEYGYRPDLGEKSPAEIYAGVLTEAQINLFEEEYLPPQGDTGFHDVTKIVVLEVVDEKVLFKHKRSW